MPTMSRSALVSYSAEQMYCLVTDITQYPVFLNWCDGATIDSLQGNNIVATVGIAYKGINKHFTTRNVNTNRISADGSGTVRAIDMQLVDGPFSKLVGRWRFDELSPEASKVQLNMEFEVSNILLRPILSPAFGEIIDLQVTAFTRRADCVYGEG